MAENERPVKSCASVKANPEKFIQAALQAYNPDEQFAEKHRKALIPEFFSKLLTNDESGHLPELVESARLLEVNCFGAYRIRYVYGSDEFRKAINEASKKAGVVRRLVESGVKLREAGKFNDEEKAQLKKISESARFKEDFGFDTDANPNDPFNEYIPIMGGPFSKQLYIHDMLDAFAKSFEAWNHNPLAHQIVKITTHFVLGRGVTIKGADPKVHELFMAWWGKNKMDERLDYWSDMLSRDGELMIRCYQNKMTGELFLRWVDPSTVWEIVTDLEDIETVYYYHQQYPTQYQVLYGAPQNAKFNPSQFDSSKYVINQIPADQMYHVKINCSPNEKRGRSDLFSILGWLKRWKDFQTAVVLRAIIQSTFAWKNKLKGNNADVQAFINTFGTDQPEFGSVWVENEASELTPMTADTSGGTPLADCPGIINAIAVGSGIPKEYLGMSDHGTRATAVVSSEPGAKKFQSRQLLLARLLKDIADRWLSIEQMKGRLPLVTPDAETNEVKPLDKTIEFQFPEIAVEDRSSKLKDIQSTQVAGYISKKRAATMSAKELGVPEYSYEDEQEEIGAEQQADAEALYAATGLTGGGGAGGDNPPGNPVDDEEQPAPSGGLSQQDRRDIKRNDRR